MVKREKHVFRKQETTPHYPGVPGTFLDKSEKSTFDDDFDFWGTIFGIPFVENP